MFAGALARLVSEKFAEVAPVALATTLYGPPAVAFAVNVGAVATPLASVFTITDVTDPGKVPLAPLEGAANVTGAFGTRFPLASVTLAFRAVPNAAPIVVLCPEPAVAAMFAAVPALFVTLKFAVPMAPAFAVTV